MPVNKTSPSKKKYYERYKANHTREKNKLAKLMKLFKLNQNNPALNAQIKKLQDTIGKK